MQLLDTEFCQKDICGHSFQNSDLSVFFMKELIRRTLFSSLNIKILQSEFSLCSWVFPSDPRSRNKRMLNVSKHDPCPDPSAPALHECFQLLHNINDFTLHESASACRLHHSPDEIIYSEIILFLLSFYKLSLFIRRITLSASIPLNKTRPSLIIDCPHSIIVL